MIFTHTGNTGASRQGPLSSLRVIEFAGLGAAPFAAMMLADSGADVVRIERPDGTQTRAGILGRNREAIELDLKSATDQAHARELIDHADVVLEGFRPGVMERLGLGPDESLLRNPRLVYARMTGWGQSGPMAKAAGHDINYLALTGVLRSIAREGETPLPPLNLVGDYGGGGMLVLCGILTALLERASSGRGQIVDAAMIDGASLLMAGIWNRVATGLWSTAPGTNSIDGGAPFYNVYRTSDDAFMAVGAIEPHFYVRVLEGLGLPSEYAESQLDRQTWPAVRDNFAQVFRTRTRAEWTAIFDPLDACVTPVLTLAEAAEAPQISARNTLVRIDGHVEPAPAPHYSRTPSLVRQHISTVAAGAAP